MDQDGQKEQGGGFRSRLGFRLKKSHTPQNDDMDATIMTQDFRDDLAHYEAFANAMGKLTELLTCTFKPERVIPVRNQGDDASNAHGTLADALGEMKNLVHSKHHQPLSNVRNAVDKAGKHREKRSHDQIYEIRHIRKYPNDELQAYYEKKRAFEEMLHKMDAEKNRVKQSKSTAQVEKRAQAYQAIIEQFDMSTNTLIEHVETLKKGKVQCVADMYAFLDVHKKYHDELANIFAEIESKQ